MTESDTRHGLVLKGYSDQKPLYFLLAAGFTNGESGPDIEFLSAAGAPKSRYFAPVNTLSAPEEIREKILDVRRAMSRERKHFYVEEVEEQFDQFLDSNLRTVVNHLENNNLQDLEDFILNNFFKFEIDELNVATANASSLDFSSGGTQREEASAESDTGSSDDGGSGVTTIEITPEIDVQNGRKVEELRKGTSVVVRLTEESAELFGSNTDREEVRLPGDFLGFDLGENEAEGRIQVELQEGLHGVGDVSKGSLIRLYQPDEQDRRDDYEQQLEPLIFIVASLLVLLAIFAYLVIF